MHDRELSRVIELQAREAFAIGKDRGFGEAPELATIDVGFDTHDYRRNGLTSLYAALEIASGAVVGECTDRHSGAHFLRFLRGLARRFPRTELHVVLDNSSTHTTPAVKEWLAANPRVSFHFTPTGASWLNMVESWFGILTRKSIRRGSFDTVRALTRHIQAYIDHWNSHPTPFI